jgi:6-phosphogluconolactonase
MNMDLRPKAKIYTNREQLSAGLSAHVAHLAVKAAEAQGRFCVAFSGGSLLQILGPALSSHPLRDSLDWSTWHVFWADERWVPRSSHESNYGVAEKLFFSGVRIPDRQIHAADDSLSPSETAQTYESVLAKVFQPEAGRVPRFDLILLGIGEDGHIASLFPGHSALNETIRWVVPILNAPKPPPVRITMTLPLINNASHIVFVVSGPAKANILSKVLHSNMKQPQLPAQMVKPSGGELQWFLDRPAAAKTCDPAVIYR